MRNTSNASQNRLNTWSARHRQQIMDLYQHVIIEWFYRLVGFSLTRLLNGASQLIQHQRKRIYWVHLVWVLLVSNAHCATTQLDRFPVFARHQFIMLKSPVCLSWCRLECVPRRRHAGLNPIQAIVYLHQCLLFEAPPIYNSPRCHLGLLRQALRPSKGSIWLSSTLTHTCLGGLPPKLTCSGTSASARLRFTKWCSPSNERG